MKKIAANRNYRLMKRSHDGVPPDMSDPAMKGVCTIKEAAAYKRGHNAALDIAISMLDKMPRARNHDLADFYANELSANLLRMKHEVKESQEPPSE